MPLPRFKDNIGNHYEIVLACECGYAIVKGRVTETWQFCPLCTKKELGNKPLKTKRIDYGIIGEPRIK